MKDLDFVKVDHGLGRVDNDLQDLVDGQLYFLHMNEIIETAVGHVPSVKLGYSVIIM